MLKPFFDWQSSSDTNNKHTVSYNLSYVKSNHAWVSYQSDTFSKKTDAFYHKVGVSGPFVYTPATLEGTGVQIFSDRSVPKSSGFVLQPFNVDTADSTTLTLDDQGLVTITSITWGGKTVVQGLCANGLLYGFVPGDGMFTIALGERSEPIN